VRGAADLLAYAAVRGVEFVLRAMPPTTAIALSRRAGEAWWLLDARRRARADENLGVALPALAADERRRVARSSFRSMIRVPVEALWAKRLLPDERAARRRFLLLGDWPLLERDASRTGGVIATAHGGNWEMAGLALRFLKAPTRVVARPIDSPRVDAWVARMRGGSDRVIRKYGAVREAVATVRSGGWVAVLADQDGGTRGTFVPFFGLPASTRTFPAGVAERAGVPLYAALCLRRPGTMRFAVHVARVADSPAASEEGRIAARTALLTAHLEAWIRTDPGQYNWLHRRWKTRPPGEDPAVPVPRYARGLRPAPMPGAGPGEAAAESLNRDTPARR
jgi:KDO2-lipid IV(A) lauroyltransferase